MYDVAHFSFADGTNLAACFEVVGIFKCVHQYLGLYTFSHSFRSSFSQSGWMQLEIGAFYGVWSCAFFICWWHQPCCSFCGRRNFQMRTSISWTVHFLTLYALYRLTIAFSSARDWNILRCVILRIFHLLMALSMLLVKRFEEFSSAHISTLDCTPSDTVCALASISPSISMHPEFGTSCA